MGRPRRAAQGGIIYHVLNRANGGRPIFDDDGDYLAFLDVVDEARRRVDMRIFAWCVMPKHWHFVLWPRNDGDLSSFTGWLTLTHTQRWHAHRRSTGFGHVYQGRFKSFPIQDDEHFLTVCRYVKRNALRANLVQRAEQWRWGSLHPFVNGGPQGKLLFPWPIGRTANWGEYVNTPQTEREVTAIRRAIQRGSPYGDARWTTAVAERLGVERTLTPRGRPRKSPMDHGNGS